MEKLETAVGEKQKEEVKAKSALSNKTDTLKAEQKKLKQLQKQLENVRPCLGEGRRGEQRDLMGKQRVH